MKNGNLLRKADFDLIEQPLEEAAQQAGAAQLLDLTALLIFEAFGALAGGTAVQRWL